MHSKAPKLNDWVRILKYNNIFSNGYIENWSRETFIMDSVLKTDPWTYKIKALNGDWTGTANQKGEMINLTWKSSDDV